MTIQTSLPPADGEIPVSPPAAGFDLAALKAHVVAWLQTCADYYRAASLYDELSALSDAELRRRGLNRATLGWDVCQASDRANG